MKGNYVQDYVSLTSFIFLSVMLLTVTSFINVISSFKAEAQLTDKTNTTIPKQNAQSLMEAFMSPKNLMASVIDQMRNSSAKGSNETATKNVLVKDSTTLILSHQIIPPQDFIHLYNTIPYKIVNGHIAAKLQCDANSTSSLEILVGKIPHLKPAHLDLVKEMSKPGYMCMYEANLARPFDKSPGENNTSKEIITDLALFNPTSNREVLLSTSSIAIGVSEVVPLKQTDKVNSNEFNTNLAPKMSKR
jgi:hypothetical protein